MAFTRQELTTFREDQLRTAVLMPLFSAMGYRDVFHAHGGSLEQGKDITMWKSGDLRPRVDYAVVVKRGDITGQASGPGSAGEVATQIQQCFGKPYIDSVTLAACNVDRCVVVASGRIKKEATNAIDSILKGQRLTSNIDFLDGDRLWELIEKHLPERMVREMLIQGQKYLQDNLPGHKVTVAVKEGASKILLYPVDDTAPPILQFDPSVLDQDGDETNQFKSFIETGEPLQVDNHSIAKLILPDAFRKFLDVEGGNTYELGMLNEHLASQHFQFLRVGDDGKSFELPPTELRYAQVGTKEVTLINANQDSPLKFNFKLRNDPQEFHLSFEANLNGINVKQALDWLRFHAALTTPGHIVLKDMQTSLEIVMQSDQGVAAEVDTAFIALLEMLVFIQIRTQSPIKLRSRISNEEIGLIHEVHKILQTGNGTPIDSCTFHVKKSILLQRKPDFSISSKLDAMMQKDTMWKVLDTEINLGCARIFCEKAKMSQKELKKFRKLLKTSTDEIVPVVVEGTPPTDPLNIQFPKWTPLQEKDAAP